MGSDSPDSCNAFIYRILPFELRRAGGLSRVTVGSTQLEGLYLYPYSPVYR